MIQLFPSDKIYMFYGAGVRDGPGHISSVSGIRHLGVASKHAGLGIQVRVSSLCLPKLKVDTISLKTD